MTYSPRGTALVTFDPMSCNSITQGVYYGLLGGLLVYSGLLGTVPTSFLPSFLSAVGEPKVAVKGILTIHL